MKRFAGLAFALLTLNQAHAAFTQVTVEAEQAAGGTVTSDLTASGGSTVKRTTDGIYVWWQIDSSTLSTGSYSVYARLAVNPGIASANFGPQISYGGASITNLSKVVSNRALAWVRIGSFDLNQVGGVLRIADWSSAGLSVDKMAIVKDVVVEAEHVAGGTIITDASASNGRAVTRSTTGNYAWWSPAQSDLKPGDYIVQAALASADGVPHNFGETVTLDNVASTPTNAAVASTGYQWVNLNSFVNAGGNQAIVIGDYSEAKLKLDRLRLVRRTPYEKTSTVQALYAAGGAALGEREQVTFVGTPIGVSAFKNPSKVSIVQANANTVYAYFRQEMDAQPNVFKIFMATSTDGGKTFNIRPAPIVEAPTALQTISSAYDQHVVKKADGYYMVFEAPVSYRNFCAAAAYSPDGINNWVVKNTPVCPNGVATLGASVPNTYTNVDTGQEYIQWATVDDATQTTRRYQYALPNGLFTGQLQFSQASQIASYAFPLSGAWESHNNSAGTTVYEDGYYYMIFDGSSKYDCNGRWGLGVTRSSVPGTISTWAKSSKNPFIQAVASDSCWLAYPEVVTLPGGTYVYYSNSEVEWPKAQTIYRHLLMAK